MANVPPHGALPPLEHRKQELLHMPWMDLFMRTHPGVPREQLGDFCAAQHGSLEKAAELLTRTYQMHGSLPVPEGAEPSPRSNLPTIRRQLRPHEDTLMLNINDRYALRLWEGDLLQASLYSFGFYDKHQGQPINTPAGYKVYLNDRGYPEQGRRGTLLRSLECCYRVQDGPDGSETYLVREGMSISVWRNAVRASTHEIPYRAPVQVGNAWLAGLIHPSAGYPMWDVNVSGNKVEQFHSMNVLIRK
ncbi:unnamed protein product [Cyclocybe aegerita]|uniref:Uncharacterized protein n=1 Tax=Cyclocybe aegerita TaxID=1973307 RepID=A0A8S0W112_CYCAE|nr:unnamed protein product [Cyclocybe aegerita]